MTLAPHLRPESEREIEASLHARRITVSALAMKGCRPVSGLPYESRMACQASHTSMQLHRFQALVCGAACPSSIWASA